MKPGNQFCRRPAWFVKISVLAVACLVLSTRPALVARAADMKQFRSARMAAEVDPRQFAGTPMPAEVDPIREYTGGWIGKTYTLSGGSYDLFTGKLAVVLQAKRSGGLAGFADSPILGGRAQLDRIRFRGNRIEFEAACRNGETMRFELTQTGNRLVGVGRVLFSDSKPYKILLQRKAPAGARPRSAPRAGSVEIEALIDGNTELWVTREGLQWRCAGNAAKVGLHLDNDEPTWVNGKPWKPSWGRPDEDRVADRTHIYRMNIGRIDDIRLELLAVGPVRGARGIERRDPITKTLVNTVKSRPGDPATQQIVERAVVFSIPDTQGFSKWYRFRLVRGPRPTKRVTTRRATPRARRTRAAKSKVVRLVPTSPDLLKQFVSQFPDAWRIEDGKLIGRGVGPTEKPRLTYKTWYDSIKRVEIKGSVDPAGGVGRLGYPSTNFRVVVGPINLIFNWEQGYANHYRNGEKILTTRGHALTPGTEHLIVLEQMGSKVLVTVDGKLLYTAEAELAGPVSVWPAHGSQIRISQITITGVPNNQREVTGVSHPGVY